MKLWCYVVQNTKMIMKNVMLVVKNCDGINNVEYYNNVILLYSKLDEFVVIMDNSLDFCDYIIINKNTLE